MDDLYFRKMDYDVTIHSALEHSIDRGFSSPAGLTLSCLICCERYLKFLMKELLSLKNPRSDPSWDSMNSIGWNGTKTDLVELIYSLYATGSVNGELKDIFEVAEKVFSIDLGNFYRTYTDIKYKKNPTSFLDTLKEGLLEKIRKENQ